MNVLERAECDRPAERPFVVLGAMGFDHRLSLTCLRIKQQVDESAAEAVLADMTQRLLALT
jgi:hypothetical protein